MDRFIKRSHDSENLRHLIGQFPITLLTGPRQCGKTTLARSLTPDRSFSLSTLPISSSAQFEGLCRDINASSGLVMIDDVDDCPDVLPRIRQIVDTKQDVRFLLLGSAFMPTLSEISRNLMGRVARYELGGLTLADVGGDRLLQHWFRGGMPASFLAPDDSASTAWKREYLVNLPYSSAFRESLGGSTHVLSHLISILPKQSGGILSFANVSRALEVSTSTAKRYLDILSAAGFVRLLEPFSPLHGRALRKMPKMSVRDSGLLAFLAGIHSQSELANHEMMPRMWEAYVIEQLGELIYKTHQESLLFWQDKSGAELDALWQHEGSLFGIEIQARQEPQVTKSMRASLEALMLSRVFVIYMGSTVRELAKQIIALPLVAFDVLRTGPKANGPALRRGESAAKPKKVFVSYCHKDDAFVKTLVKSLEDRPIDVTVDYKTLRLGDRIDEFIHTSVKTTEWTILIVSENSIRSPWVMAEFLETILHERVQERSRLLPITIDKRVFELGFHLELDKEFEGRIQEVNDMIRQALDRYMDIDRFTEVRRRLLDLRNNIGKALSRLNEVLVGDFSDSAQFNSNVAKLSEAMTVGD